MVLSVERRWTDLAFVGFFPGVDSDMFCQGTFISKSRWTVGTFMRFDSSMVVHVNVETDLMCESGGTNVTSEWFFLSVGSQVNR